MSEIFKVLRKIQELRDKPKSGKTAEIVYLADAPQKSSFRLWTILLNICNMIAILLSITTLLIVINNSALMMKQESKINKIIVYLNKSNFENQLIFLNNRLNKEIGDRKTQIMDWSLNDSVVYENLKQAVLNNKQQIGFLNQFIQGINNQIAIDSKLDKQTKDLVNPVAGN